MDTLLIPNWKALLFRGLLGVLVGIVALLWPSITLAWLVLLFGVYALADGILALVAAVRRGAEGQRWILIVEGLVGILIGFAAFVWPGMTTLVLVDLIAFWAIFTGVLEISYAVRMRRELPGEFYLGLAGVASIVLGILMLAWPAAGAFAIVVMLGAYALIFGISMLVLAFRLRSLSSQFDAVQHELRSRHA